MKTSEFPKIDRPTLQDLERQALDAHRAGIPWQRFWPTVAADVAAAEPYNQDRYRRLVRRLLALVVAGNLDGHQAVGEPLDDQEAPDVAPWERDDAKPRDTITRARFDPVRAGVAPSAGRFGARAAE